MAKCNECGFLTVRSAFGPETFEATEEVRQKGVAQDPINGGYTARVFCWKNSQTFVPVEVGRWVGDRGGGDENKKVVESINHEIECDSFCKWEPGKSPEKIEDMINQQMLSKLDYDFREWQKSHAEDVKKLSIQFAALSETHHQEGRKDGEAEGVITARQFWIGIAVTSLIGIAGLAVAIASFYKGS